jgi:general nucleoside transport system permease protein
MDEVALATLLASTLRVSTPLILCALAGTLSERSGVIDLGLEGKMLLAAFAAGSVGAWSGSFALALLAALVVGVALSMLHGFACVSHRGDQVVMGMAITMTAAGLTVVLGIAWFHQGGQTPPLPDTVRLSPWFGSAAAALRGLPVVGAFISLGLLGHNAMVYLALALVPALWWLLFRTRFGLRLRATGENPAMVDAAGVSIVRLRYTALAGNGVLAALAGAYLVLA